MFNKKIGIICAVENEKQELLKKYKYTTKRIYDLTFYLLNINSKEVIMVKCGVGKINATRATQILIDKFNVDLVVNYGTAGSLDKDLYYGDIIIAKACVQADVDCTAFGIDKGKFEENDEVYISTDPFTLTKVKEKIGGMPKRVLFRNIATLDQFIVDRKTNNDLYKEFNAACADMESVEVAIVCKSCNIPFIIVKVISNLVYDEDLVQKYEELKYMVSKSLIEVVEKIID